MLAAGADLFICQAYTFDAEHPAMLSYRRITAERHRLACSRLILTHVGGELEDRLDRVDIEVAWDGQRIVL